MKQTKDKLQGTVVFKSIQLGQKLGVGAFGEIYFARNKQNDNSYAIKVEPVTTKHPQLMFQAKLYKYLHSNGTVQGIPKVYGVGSQSGYNFMLMDLLSSSLEDLFARKNKKFSIKTVLMIGQQLIDRIQAIHCKGFLHRDIKPDNLLMGLKSNKHVMYLVDMGLAKKYIKDGKHIPYKDGKELTGTARYASINTHKGIQQGRRDDIQSMGYVLMYFLRGILPWQNMKAKDTKQKYTMIMEKKISTPLQVLCQGYPAEFSQIIQYARALNFEQEPDYSYLKGLIKTAKNRLGVQTDFEYDWSTETDKQSNATILE